MTSTNEGRNESNSALEWVTKESFANIGLVSFIITAIVNFFGNFVIKMMEHLDYSLYAQLTSFIIALLFVLGFRMKKIKGNQFQRIFIVLANVIVLSINCNGLQSVYSGLTSDDKGVSTTNTQGMMSNVFSSRPWIIPLSIREELRMKDSTILSLKDSLATKFDRSIPPGDVKNTDGYKNFMDAKEREIQNLRDSLNTVVHGWNICLNQLNNQDDCGKQVSTLLKEKQTLQMTLRNCQSNLEECYGKLNTQNSGGQEVDKLKVEIRNLHETIDRSQQDFIQCTDKITQLKKDAERLKKESYGFQDQSSKWFQENLKYLCEEIEKI